MKYRVFLLWLYQAWIESLHPTGHPVTAAVLSTTVNSTHFMQILWTTVVNLGSYSRPKALANLTHVGEDYKFESKVYRFLFVCLCLQTEAKSLLLLRAKNKLKPRLHILDWTEYRIFTIFKCRWPKSEIITYAYLKPAEFIYRNRNWTTLSIIPSWINRICCK